MTEQNILVYKLFLPLKIPVLVYFSSKSCNPSWKRSPPLFQQPPLKIEVLSSPPPPFWEFGRRFIPPCRKRGAHYVLPAKDSFSNTQYWHPNIWTVITFVFVYIHWKTKMFCSMSNLCFHKVHTGPKTPGTKNQDLGPTTPGPVT